MALSPQEAFLSDDERKELAQLEQRVDAVLKGFTGGNSPIYFTHTIKGDNEVPSSVLSALINRYEESGWRSVQHVNTNDGKGLAFTPF